MNLNTMTISEKLGNINDTDWQNRSVDWLALDWYETNKRILHKKSNSGVAITFRFLQGDPVFTQGDIVYSGEETIIAINILPCDVMVLAPRDMYEMASVSYETGNKHLPLYYDNDELLIPFDPPFFRLMSSFGYAVKKESRQLLNPLKTTVKPHGDTRETIFSKLMKITAANE